MGADIVIDDLSNEAYFDYLEKSGYIMLNKPHKLLSALRKE